MTALQCQQLLALGNLHGYIKLLKLDNRGIKINKNIKIIVSGGRYCICVFVCFLGTCTAELVWQAHDGKVFSLTWTTVVLREAPGATIPLNLLLSCGPGGELVSLHLIRFKTHSECCLFCVCVYVCVRL